jgi:hypothetical protein
MSDITRRYKLIGGMMPPGNIRGVWIHGGHDGLPYIMVQGELIALCVARVLTRDGQDTYDTTEVVGIELEENVFQVCESAENFCGYCQDGEDITQVASFLSGDLLKAWLKHFDADGPREPQGGAA